MVQNYHMYSEKSVQDSWLQWVTSMDIALSYRPLPELAVEQCIWGVNVGGGY